MRKERLGNIVLCGLPGAGKTTVGKQLAALFDREFIDTDKVIEERYDVSCREFFQIFGEHAFRELEKEVVLSLQDKEAAVIALGGGTVEIPEVLKIIPFLGIVVLLVEDIEELIKRKIIDDTPATASDKKSYKKLANRRISLLRNIANIEVNCNNKNSNEISQEIIEKYTKYTSSIGILNQDR
ncbi:MAG: shikimate kinase [Chlamydiota bacterium]